MKKETLVIRPEKHKRRIGVLPTYAQRDRTKYTRKAKHCGQNSSAGKHRRATWKARRFPCCSCRCNQQGFCFTERHICFRKQANRFTITPD